MDKDKKIAEILDLRTVAVVGCSPREDRPSHQVAAYLKKVGYKVIPVRPGTSSILGEPSYPNLTEVPEKIEVVVIFRRSEHVHPIVRDAIRVGARAVWMQDGVEHALAAEEAEKAGLQVVMNDCILRAHRRRNGPFRKTVTTCG